MVSEIKKGLSIHPTSGSITTETTTGDMLVKKDGNAQPSDRSQTKSASSSSHTAEAKGALHMEGALRRMTVEQDLNQPDMAAKGYQHNQTDLEFLNWEGESRTSDSRRNFASAQVGPRALMTG